METALLTVKNSAHEIHEKLYQEYVGAACLIPIAMEMEPLTVMTSVVMMQIRQNRDNVDAARAITIEMEME
jgi:hypothetical protein